MRHGRAGKSAKAPKAMTNCQDIREKCSPYCTSINGAILLAVVAAIISSTVRYDADQARASVVLLESAHWALVILLVGSYVQPTRCVNPDIEVTWLIYGFLMGEISADVTVCVCLVILSAIMYYYHRRAAAAKPDVDVAIEDEMNSAIM